MMNQTERWMCRRRLSWQLAVWVSCWAGGLLLAATTLHAQNTGKPPTNNKPSAAATQPAEDEGFREPSTASGWLSVEPFDRITLNNENRGMVLYCLPLDLPERQPPELPRRTGSMKLRRVEEPDEQYELDWVAVVRIDLFEQLLLSEAQRFTEKGEFFSAFQLFSRLFADYPRTPGLAEAFEKYLQADALASFRQGRYDAALISLSELAQRKSGTKEEVEGALRRVVERVLEGTFEEGRYEVLREQLDQFAKRFGPSVQATVTTWEKRLRDVAVENYQAAKKLGPEQAVQQRRLCQAALRAWPEVPGAAELLEEIFAANTVLRVGVLNPQAQPQPQQVANWSAQRLASLLARPLVEIRDFAAEGVVCESRLGTFEVLGDHTGWSLTLSPSSGTDAFAVYEALLPKLEEGSPQLEAWLATPVKQLYPLDRQVLALRWRRPMLESLALLNTALELPPAQSSPLLRPYAVMGSAGGQAAEPTAVSVEGEEAGSGVGSGSSAAAPEPLDHDGQLESGDGGVSAAARESMYQRQAAVTTGPAHIVEVPLGGSEGWEDRWLQGDVDIIDRLRPIERDAVQAWQDARVVRYRFPSQHWLLFNRQKPTWESKEVRRSLLYGIDRQRLLQDIFLGTTEHPGCLVTSGPCPAGWTRDDPLAFGYITNLPPRSYDPVLAKVLLQLHLSRAKKPGESATKTPSTNESAAATSATATSANEQSGGEGANGGPPGGAAEATTQGEAAATQPLEIVLAYPQDHLIEQACEEIAVAWQALGAKCELRPLPVGQVVPNDDNWDLLYVDVRIRDPLTDFHRLFGPNGQLPSPGAYVRTAEQQLNQVAEWAELRSAMTRLQQFAYDDVALLPLWQVVDYAVVRRRLSGVADNLIGLYDDVETWRWSPADSKGGQP